MLRNPNQSAARIKVPKLPGSWTLSKAKFTSLFRDRVEEEEEKASADSSLLPVPDADALERYSVALSLFLKTARASHAVLKPVICRMSDKLTSCRTPSFADSSRESRWEKP
jgi:hypothetical protein